MTQQNFNNSLTLSNTDIEQIVSIVCYHCQIKTYNRVRSILTYSKSLIPQYGILGRLICENGQWKYVPGQSYSDEIRIIKTIILKAY